MNNPFQDQLLKAGVATKKQVQKAKQAKSRKNKKQRTTQHTVVDEAKINAAKSVEDKKRRDRELNENKQQTAKKKAIIAEIKQLIANNRLVRDESCDVAYHFKHHAKIKQLYVSEEMKKGLVNGSLGLVCMSECYELVPAAVAKKIQQRDDVFVVVLESETPVTDEEGDYAAYQVPDDLMW